MRFLLRRLLHSFGLLIVISFLSFLLVDLAPGDFFEEIRLNPQVSRESVEALRSQRGAKGSALLNYWRWLKSIGKGDWGTSLAYNSSIAALLKSRARNTLLLTSLATMAAWIVAIPLGVCAAARPGGWIDSFTGGVIRILLATPDLVLALLLLLLAARTGLFPLGGITSPRIVVGANAMEQTWMETSDMARHLFLPALCLTAGLFPMLLLHVRAAAIEALQSPYLLAARANGIAMGRLLLRYVLPIAANPLISLFGLSIGMLMSSSLLIEAVFSWPGLGELTLEALMRRDFQLITDATVVAAAFLVFGNFVSDVLLYATDPRIRAD